MHESVDGCRCSSSTRGHARPDRDPGANAVVERVADRSPDVEIDDDVRGDESASRCGALRCGSARHATRDLEALRRRLTELPGELAAELEAIDRRFAVTHTTLFPAAVTWLVPAGGAR